MMGRLGTAQVVDNGKIKSRKPPNKPPQREGPLWGSVVVTKEHPTSPTVKCDHCNGTFCGGATQIATHIMEQCTGHTDAFMTLKTKTTEVHLEKQATKKQKLDNEEVNVRAAGTGLGLTRASVSLLGVAFLELVIRAIIHFVCEGRAPALRRCSLYGPPPMEYVNICEYAPPAEYRYSIFFFRLRRNMIFYSCGCATGIRIFVFAM
jgi:hypothetical protein